MTIAWTPLLSFVVFMLIFALGDYISTKTKGVVCSIMVVSILYLAGFWTGIIPKDSILTTGLYDLTVNIGLALILVEVGTFISLEQLFSEWRSVLISLAGVIGVALVTVTAGTWLFGKVYAFSAGPVVSGGIVAAYIVQAAAEANAMPAIGAFALFVCIFQGFIGIPIGSLLLKKEVGEMLSLGMFDSPSAAGEKKIANIKFPQVKLSKMSSLPNMRIARVALVAAVAYLVSQLTAIPGTVPQIFVLDSNVAYLLFGILARKIGFLEAEPLTKSNTYGLFMLALLSTIPAGLAGVTPKDVVSFIIPLLGMLLLGAAVLLLFGLVIGKFLKVRPKMAMYIALGAMITYPPTYVICDEVLRTLDATEEQKKNAAEYLYPKMMIAPFTAVCIAAVIFASIIAPYIFS